MNTIPKHIITIYALALLLLTFTKVSAQISSVTPSQNALNVSPSTNISVTFGFDVNASTLSNSTIRVRGSKSGLHPADIIYNETTKNVTINPISNFLDGEDVNVTLTTEIENISGAPMTPSFGWNFEVSVRSGTGSFRQVKNAGSGDLGQGVFSTVMFDVDNDYDLDVAVLSQVSNNIHILKNNGSGVFFLTTSISTGVSPYFMTAGDIDNDGDIDLVSSNGGENTLSVFYNSGDGSFTFVTSPSVGVNPRAVILGDIDSDGDLDIAVANVNSSSVSILKNDGNGGFAPAISVNVGNSPYDIGFGDIDNDGDLDFIATNYNSSTIKVMKNDGSGSFTVFSSPAVGINPSSIVLADIDHDNDLDMGVVNYGSNTVSILKNSGSGIFSLDSTQNVPSYPSKISSGDIDSDGDVDLILTNIGFDHSIILFKNDGNGNFTQQTFSNLLAPNISIGDVDNDNDLDVLAVDFSINSLFVLKNRSLSQEISISPGNYDFNTCKVDVVTNYTLKIINEGASTPLQINNITSSNSAFTANPTSASIAASETLTVNVSFKPTDIVNYFDSLIINSNDPDRPNIAFYVTGSGAPSVGSSSPAKNAIYADRTTNVSAQFTNPIGTILPSAFKIFGEISGRHRGSISYDALSKTATLDPDTNFVFGEKVQVVLTDALTSSPDGIKLIGGYSWKFTTALAFANGNYYLDGTSYTPQTGPFAVASGDLNQDSYTDLVIANSGSSSISLFMNINGALSTSPNNLTVGSNPQGIVISDIDGDGDGDIITANNTSNNISVLRNNGNGNFAASVQYSTGVGSRGITAADIDKDGDNDIVTANVSGNGISIFLNDGNGIFGVPLNVSVGVGPRGLIVEDLDNDGDMDIASCNFGSNNITVLLNNGTGLIYQSFPYLAGTGPNSITAFDFDSDGDVDIATANGISNNISILKNNGSGIFAAPVNVSSAGQPIALYGNDFDSDQDIDLACVNFSSNNVIIFKNNGSCNFTRTDTIATGTGPRSISGIDIGGNGVLELAVANLTAGSVSVLRNQVGGRAIQVGSFSYNFGNVRKNTIARYTLNINNPGADSVLHIINIIASNPRITLSRTALNIPSGASDTLTVMFTPETYGSFSDTLTLLSDADNNPALEIKLSGSSLSAIASSVVTMDFGNVRKDATKQALFKIKNTNEVNDLVLNSLDLTGPYFSKNLSTPIIIPVADSFSVTISFTPTLSGSFQDTLTINSNAANKPIMKIPLSGVSQPPASPQNLMAEAGIEQVSISWRKNTEDYFMRYRIYGGTTLNPVAQLDSTIDRLDTTKIIFGLTNGTTYYFRVTALDSSYSESNFSNEVSATPDADPAPSAPQNLSATPGNRQVILFWRKNPEADFLRYRIYAGTSQQPTTLWDSTNVRTDTTKTISGLTNNTTFYFRIAAVDIAGHVSFYSNQVSATPQDLVPPLPPTQLTATTGNSQITLRWMKNTEPDFLRYRIYFGLSQNTTLLWDSSAQRTDTIKTYTGLTNGTTYYVRVTAIDSSYNQSSYSNEVSVTPALEVSIVASSIQVTNGTPSAGTNVGISVQVNGTNPSVKLFYGKPDQSPGDSLTMIYNGTAYAATISGTSVTQEGLWYRIRAQNSAGLNYYPLSENQAISVLITSLSEVKIISAFPDGINYGGYFTIALSLNGSLNPATLFGPQEFTAGGPSNWRVLAFNTADQNFSDVTSLTGGSAYAIYHKSGTHADIFSGINNASTISSDVFNNWTLKPGWNLVPWPYTFLANISSIDNSKIGKIWWRNGKDGWEEVTQLKPFGSYMIRNKTGSDLSLGSVLAWTRGSGKIISSFQGGSWMRFIAEAGEYRDAFNFIGTENEASENRDGYDESDPLVMGSGVNAYFAVVSQNGEEKMAYDIRPRLAAGHAWDLIVENTMDRKDLKLSWELPVVNSFERIILVDITHNKRINVNEHTNYTYTNSMSTHFKVFAGKAGWVEQKIQQLESELPSSFAIYQNYPNPFNPTTHIAFDIAQSGHIKIKVYNILGQEVKTLVSRYYETGRYNIEWDGRDDRGQTLSSGVYIYRFEAGKISKVKKMLLVK